MCGSTGTCFDSLDVHEIEKGPAASCLLLPSLPGVDVFTFSHCDGAPQPGDTESEIFLPVDDLTRIPKDKQVKLILWFLTNPASDRDQALGERLLQRYEGAILAGGYVLSVLPDVASDT